MTKQSWFETGGAKCMSAPARHKTADLSASYEASLANAFYAGKLFNFRLFEPTNPGDGPQALW